MPPGADVEERMDRLTERLELLASRDSEAVERAQVVEESRGPARALVPPATSLRVSRPVIPREDGAPGPKGQRGYSADRQLGLRRTNCRYHIRVRF